jgi:protein SCO1/2
MDTIGSPQHKVGYFEPQLFLEPQARLESQMHRILLVALVLSISSVGSRASSSGLPLPSPGSYTLNHIQRVPFAIVLEGSYVPRPLSHYTKGAITLLSFFYTSCADREGCPRAWEAFENIRHEIQNRPHLHNRARLVFVSLDPSRDTPRMLRFLGQSTTLSGAKVPWHFLTTYSTGFLERLLHEMGTDVAIDRTASSAGIEVLNHLLKVFLVDNEGWVREIYANATLDPTVMLGDIETLVKEEQQRRAE